MNPNSSRAAAGGSMDDTLPSIDTDEDEGGPDLMSPKGGDGDFPGSSRSRQRTPRGTTTTSSSQRRHAPDSPSQFLDYSDVLDDDGDELLSDNEDSIPTARGMGANHGRILEQVARMYAATQSAIGGSRRNLRGVSSRGNSAAHSAATAPDTASEASLSSGELDDDHDDADACSICHTPGHTSARCPLWKSATPGDE